jgi:hypothetical protein
MKLLKSIATVFVLVVLVINYKIDHYGHEPAHKLND